MMVLRAQGYGDSKLSPDERSDIRDSSRRSPGGWVRALLSGVKYAAPRPGHEWSARSAVICPSGSFVSSLISDFPKNISVSIHPKSHLEFFASHPTRGAYRDRHGRGEGCGGRGSVRRATWLQGGLAKGL
jgi:hypothetical protein